MLGLSCPTYRLRKRKEWIFRPKENVDTKNTQEAVTVYQLEDFYLHSM
jgi:hypothetical protein